MGFYLNSTAAGILYRDEATRPYFVDKTNILKELFPLIKEGSSFLCITRPRRFGKTVMANMIASFLSKGCDMADVFDSLHVSKTEDYHMYLNHYNVIHIVFNEIPRNCCTYQQYIERIETKLINDLIEAYPDAKIHEDDAVWDAFKSVNAMDADNRFVFVLDE